MVTKSLKVAGVYTQTQADSRYVNKSVGGMTLIVPTSVTGTGGTLNPNGSVSLSSVGTSGITINGCFTSAYNNYEIIFIKLRY